MANSRGKVIALTADQIVARATSMVGAKIYYRLEYPNGGTDPTAPDPAARWSKEHSSFVNITCDCVGFAAWASGFDRLQERRMPHVYDGRINCDSMRIEAASHGHCFMRLSRPELGCMVAYGSLDHDKDGHRDLAGHVGIVVGVPAEWDATKRSCWAALDVIDCASRSPAVAIQHTSGSVWYGTRMGVPKNAWFIRSLMTPEN